MKNSLFIGNRLNWSIISDIAWDDLLQNIAEEYGVEYLRVSVPRILGRHGTKKDDYSSPSSHMIIFSLKAKTS